MLTANEKSLLAQLDAQEIYDCDAAIATFDRRSGRPGERSSIDVMIDILTKAGVKCHVNEFPAWLSDPVKAHLRMDGKELYCKTWSFCANTNGVLKAPAVFVEAKDLARNPLDLMGRRLTSLEKDLTGKIVVTLASGPVPLMNAADRGAVGIVSCWEHGDEKLVHESNVNMIWGQPDPAETGLYNHLPVVGMNYADGHALIEKVKQGGVVLEMETKVEERQWTLPILEAVIEGDSEDYILLGNHLDSWFYGASDNGTGNAIALTMAKLFAQTKGFKRGLKICWWSGHSNGRYAGSEAYVRKNYRSLRDHCLALCNTDLPGQRGATDFGRGSSTPDLEPLYAGVVTDVTNQKLRHSAYVTGWDMTLKNLGISSCMSWSSTPPDGSSVATGSQLVGGFMTRWWHTEDDVMDYVDKDILLTDAKIYALSINRLLTADNILNPAATLDEVQNELKAYACAEELRAALSAVRSDIVTDRDPKSLLRRTRLLNKMLYAFKGAHEQDWATGLHYVPGLWLAENSHPVNDREKLMVDAFRERQINRLWDLVDQL
ncbi:MAG: M28 family peptidase [Pyramidobacter sp.]|nr:M28 family peptidase [Pyramidobacter sp.]